MATTDITNPLLYYIHKYTSVTHAPAVKIGTPDANNGTKN